LAKRLFGFSIQFLLKHWQGTIQSSFSTAENAKESGKNNAHDRTKQKLFIIGDNKYFHV